LHKHLGGYFQWYAVHVSPILPLSMRAWQLVDGHFIVNAQSIVQYIHATACPDDPNFAEVQSSYWFLGVLFEGLRYLHSLPRTALLDEALVRAPAYHRLAYTFLQLQQRQTSEFNGLNESEVCSMSVESFIARNSPASRVLR
jgi:hypothetical protein